ncbi:MAG: pimeloyl-ACP methyl ester esterase BioH [Gammaproteobacteria bacterium]|nr:pimeloyl-ACP methyl ester esterase BioH [Gammaproteobacteria bacterium]
MNKPALVLLHGWGVNRCVWNTVANRLRHRFRVSALDLPGYGDPSVARDADNLTAMAMNLLTAVPRQAVWLGWSLGGMVALRMAKLAPGRVTGLVLVGTTPRFVASPDWEHGVEAHQLTKFAADLAADYERTLGRFLLLQAGRVAHARRVARDLGRHIARCGAPTGEVLDASLHALVSADLRSELPAIRAPVRIIHGQFDRLVSPGAARYLARRLPAAELTVLPDAGHAAFISDPDAFAALIDLGAGE